MLGVPRDATQAEIAAAYRRLVRALHPDAGEPDRERLAAVLAAYRALREGPREAPPVPVRRPVPGRRPDVRAGPVRWER